MGFAFMSEPGELLMSHQDKSEGQLHLVTQLLASLAGVYKT